MSESPQKAPNAGTRTPNGSVSSLAGLVAAGAGQGADFTQLDWARRQFIEYCGIDPFPGTLNLSLPVEVSRSVIEASQSRAHRIEPPDSTACSAAAHPVRVNGHYPAAVVIPEVDGYAADRVELVAAIGLRAELDLQDGHQVQVEPAEIHDVTAVFFDVDGTLLNSLDGYQLAASRATESYGYEVSLAHVREALDTNQPFWDFIIPAGEPRDQKRIAHLREETMRHWPDALAEVVAVIPGVAEALHALKNKGLTLGIMTGSAGESFPPLVAAGLLDLFDVIVTSDDISNRKPDPEGLLRCLQQSGVAAERAVYVGDSSIDMTASSAAGMRSMGVLTGAGNSASLTRAGAYRMLADASSLPGQLARD